MLSLSAIFLLVRHLRRSLVNHLRGLHHHLLGIHHLRGLHHHLLRLHHHLRRLHHHLRRLHHHLWWLHHYWGRRHYHLWWLHYGLRCHHYSRWGHVDTITIISFLEVINMLFFLTLRFINLLLSTAALAAYNDNDNQDNYPTDRSTNSTTNLTRVPG